MGAKEVFIRTWRCEEMVFWMSWDEFWGNTGETGVDVGNVWVPMEIGGGEYWGVELRDVQGKRPRVQRKALFGELQEVFCRLDKMFATSL